MKTAAILGASRDHDKFGNKAVRAFQLRGFRVFPINPHEESIEGATVYPSISALPIRPDVVSVYLQPRVLLGLLPEIASKGCDELWLNPGTDSEEVVTEARRLRLNVIQACSIVGQGLSPETL
jgi:predicted CoA-binding protein